METKTRSPSDASVGTPSEIQDATAAFTMLLHRNVERMANLQKTTLDVLNSQTKDLTDTMRTKIKPPAGTPIAAFFDFAAQGMENWVSTQKSVLDLVVQQSAQTANVTENKGTSAFPSVGNLSELIQQSVERTNSAQKAMLDFAAKQNEAAVQAFKGQTGVAGTPLDKVADSVDKGVSTFVNKQKEFLDSATKITKDAVATRAAGH